MDINFNNEMALDYDFKMFLILLLVIYDAHLYSFSVHAIVEIKHLYYTMLYICLTISNRKCALCFHEGLS